MQNIKIGQKPDFPDLSGFRFLTRRREAAKKVPSAGPYGIRAKGFRGPFLAVCENKFVKTSEFVRQWFFGVYGWIYFCWRHAAAFNSSA